MIHYGTEQVVTAGDGRYRLSRFTRGLYRQWLVWARQQIPSPLQAAQSVLALDLSDELKSNLLWDVVQLCEAYGTMADVEFQRLWLSDEGRTHVIELLLYKYHFDVSKQVAEEIASTHDTDAILKIAEGIVPNEPIRVVERFLAEKKIKSPTSPDNPADQWAKVEKEGAPALTVEEWERIDRDIFNHLHKTPVELDELTLSELVILHRESIGLPDPRLMKEILSTFPMAEQISLVSEIYG